MIKFELECGCYACSLGRYISSDPSMKAMRKLLTKAAEKVRERPLTKEGKQEIRHYINVRRLELTQKFLKENP